MSTLKSLAASLAHSPPFDFARRSLQLALRRYPFMTGGDRIVYQPPFSILARGLDAEIVPLRGGGRLLVSPREHVGLILMWLGDLDPKISLLLPRLIGSGDTVFDVGANVGWFTLSAARLVGAQGHVHAFEPQPRPCRFLEASVVLNDLQNVTVHPYGLSDRTSTQVLRVSRHNHGFATLDHARVAEGDQVEVRLRQAESVLEEMGDVPIKLLKIDTEGHEATILHACAHRFRSAPPASILFESNLDDRPLMDREVFRLLDDLGFVIFGIRPHRLTVRLEPVEKDTPEGDSWDFLALHRSVEPPEGIRGLIQSSAR